MDADFSHPVEKIVDMYKSILLGFDFVIGSRYTKGGSIVGWTLHRKIFSKIATLLARPFTNVKDPMSGFFLVKREIFNIAQIDSKGFKILLELLVKSKSKNILEIPITFIDRQKGSSKANISEFFLYLKNLFGYINNNNELLKFCLVGFLGTIINILLLYLLTEKLNMFYIYSAIIAFAFSVSNNFLLNKIWKFNEKIKINIYVKYVKYITISILALVVNIIVLFVLTEYLNFYYIVSQIFAILFAMIINFWGNKIWTFQK